MEQVSILRLYDTDLLTSSLSEHGIEGLKAGIHEINQSDAPNGLSMKMRAGFPSVERRFPAKV